MTAAENMIEFYNFLDNIDVLAPEQVMYINTLLMEMQYAEISALASVIEMQSAPNHVLPQ